MSLHSRGFTLIEVLITSLIATCGLVAVATMFSFAISVNASNREMAEATALLYDKMEQFKSAPMDSPLWTDGDGSEDVVRDITFTRAWEIIRTAPYSVTITVYAESALTHRSVELIRATTLLSRTF